MTRIGRRSLSPLAAKAEGRRHRACSRLGGAPPPPEPGGRRGGGFSPTAPAHAWGAGGTGAWQHAVSKQIAHFRPAVSTPVLGAPEVRAGHHLLSFFQRRESIDAAEVRGRWIGPAELSREPRSTIRLSQCTQILGHVNCVPPTPPRRPVTQQRKQDRPRLQVSNV
jgi:hypothetical protein